ncbi:MAG: DNA primase [Patescibacteria group bacterium]
MQPSEEIKSKLDVVDVIKEYIQIKPAGTNFRGLCPFHNEKNPSFMVSPEKQIWHCFGCAKGGDIFAFVMEIEGITFAESLRMLAQKAGVVLEHHNPKLVSQKNRILEIIEISAKHFNDNMMQGRDGEKARKYLEERGLKEETIEEWEIGYSRESWDDLFNHLRKKGFNENEIFLAGMTVKRDKMSGFYDRFRGRIMFPIKDINGNTVAFTARVMPGGDDKQGKYINSPQTPVYDKSKLLFGLDKAKIEIKKKELAVLVEGQMDVITAHQHGFRNIIASSGTSLTVEQINLLKRYSTNIALAFDMDNAGEMASERGMKTAMQMDMNIKVIEVPNGKDPDECIKQSPEVWKKAVETAKPMMRYCFDKIISKLNLDNIEHKRQAAKKLLPVIGELNSRIEQDYWVKRLSELIDIKEYVLRETLAKALSPKAGKKESRQAEKKLETATDSKEEKSSQILLALLLKFPSLIEMAANRIQPDQISGKDNQSLYRSIIIFYNNIVEAHDGLDAIETETNYKNVRNWLENEFGPENANNNSQIKLLEKIAVLGDCDFADYEPEQARNEMLGILAALKKNYLVLRMKEMEKLISQAEREKDNESIKDLMKEFKLLTDELRELK